MQIRFLKTAVLAKDWPKLGPAEVAMVGRSNAGKSSLINAFSGSKIAKVSSTPGKTRALNFFDVNGKYRIVDMPGYGYAARSGNEVKSWRKMIESYLLTRSPLVGLILVCDIRRKWTDDEQDIVDVMAQAGRPTLIALTKADKVGKNEMRNRVLGMKKEMELSSIFPVSNTKRFGSTEIEDYIFHEWIQPFIEKDPLGEEERL